jgi:hypothetical protein
MSRIEWSDEYLLGIPEIDLQHKKLLSLANDAAATVEQISLKSEDEQTFCKPIKLTYLFPSGSINVEISPFSIFNCR